MAIAGLIFVRAHYQSPSCKRYNKCNRNVLRKLHRLWISKSTEIPASNSTRRLTPIRLGHKDSNVACAPELRLCAHQVEFSVPVVEVTLVSILAVDRFDKIDTIGVCVNTGKINSIVAIVKTGTNRRSFGR